MPAPEQPVVPRLTDSPWFWAYVFSTMGVVALFVMEGKYEHRQTHIEDEYRYATRTLAKPPSATPGDTSQATAHASLSADLKASTPDKSPLSSGPQPLTHELLISLWPLRLIAVVAMMVSCVALQLSHLRRRRAARSSV